jgi:DNA-binding CsgD family transcriptional regulator
VERILMGHGALADVAVHAVPSELTEDDLKVTATLAEGAELAHRCGATTLVDQARAELRLAGARPRRIAQTGRGALTPAELRVVELAAQGDTNKQIAQALFVTLRTVEAHLSSSYRKLDIETREQLPAALGDDEAGN